MGLAAHSRSRDSRVLNISPPIRGITSGYSRKQTRPKGAVSEAAIIHVRSHSKISGLSICWFRSSVISVYIAGKAVEVLYFKAVGKEWLPKFYYGDALLFALAVGVLIHAVFLERHNVQPPYWNLAAVYLLLAVSTAVHCQSCENVDAEVMILGAGISGIAAAKTLYDNGVTDFIILEQARNLAVFWSSLLLQSLCNLLYISTSTCSLHVVSFPAPNQG